MGSDVFSEFDLLPPLAQDTHEIDLTAVKSLLTRGVEGVESDPADFKDGCYKGFPVLEASQLPAGLPGVHASLPGRFYVASPLGAVGLVPWEGSKIIWPWEAGWVQDLHRENVQSLLKPTEEKKKK